MRRPASRRVLLICFSLAAVSAALVSCQFVADLFSDGPAGQEEWITFLPEDREYEKSRLEPGGTWNGSGADAPEWEFVGPSAGYDPDNALAYHIKAAGDSDGNGTSDLTYLRELGRNFRFSFTFRGSGDEFTGPRVCLPSVGGERSVLIRPAVSAGQVEMVVSEHDSSGEVSSESSKSDTAFSENLWYTIYIDVEDGYRFTVDIDERDGGTEGYDDDIIDFTVSLFQGEEVESYAFHDPVIRALSDAGDYWIGSIYYRDCSDGYWPDPHTLQ